MRRLTVLLAVLALAATAAGASLTRTWSCSSGAGYTYSATRVMFRNQSAELIPSGLQLDWAHDWADLDTTDSWRVTVDPAGNIYAKGFSGAKPSHLRVTKYSSSLIKAWDYVDSPGANYDYYKYGRVCVDAAGNVYTGGALKWVPSGQWYWYVVKVNAQGQFVWRRISAMANVVSTPGFMRLFGPTKTAVGLASAVPFLLTLILVYLLGLRLFDRRVAIIGTLFMAVSLWVLRCSISGLEAPLLGLLFTALIWVLYLGIDSKRRTWWMLGAGVLLGLLALTKEVWGLTLLPVLWYVSFGIPRMDRRARWVALAAVFGGFVVAILPWCIRQGLVTGNPFFTAMAKVVSTPGFIADTGGSPPNAVEYGANVFVLGPSGNLYAMGLVYPDALRVVKYDKNGNVQWDKVSGRDWTYPVEPGDALHRYIDSTTGGAWAGAVDSQENLYTTGPGLLAPWPGRGEDYVTTKLNSAGNLLWARAWSAPGNAMDRPEGIAVDSAGNVYVGGFSNMGGFKPVAIMYGPQGGLKWARNSYNSTALLPSANNGNLLSGALDFAGNFIAYGGGVGGGLVVGYNSVARRVYYLSGIIMPTGAAGGWCVAPTDGYLYLVPTDPAAASGLARYSYTYPSDRTAAVTVTGPSLALPYQHLYSFADQTTGPGQVKYQLSPDGATWYWYTGTAWTAGGNCDWNANSAALVSSHLAKYVSQFGPGTLYCRVFLDRSHFASLRQFTIGYDTTP